MISNLRKKFIFAAMASTLGVLLVIMSILNIANYVRVVSDADATLAELGKNDGEFDKSTEDSDSLGGPGSSDSDITDSASDASNSDKIPSDAPDLKGGRKDKPGDGMNGFSPETPFQTRYFSVTAKNGEITSCKLDNIAAVDEDTAKKYAEEILADGDDSGFMNIYRYLMVTDGDESMIIFVDCRQELQSFRNTLVYSVGVSLAGFLVVFMLVLFWSKRIFAPVAESYEKQKRFITDASHEIKTPLTIIDANTEVIEMMDGESEWTQNTRAQVKRLTALTNQMVSLSKLDENPEPQMKTEFNMSELVYEVLDHFESLAEIRDKKIKSDIQGSVMYVGDENNIRQLISILVDNAMKYAVSGRDISISLSRDGKKVRFTLSNLTDGLEAGDQSVLFERFYRPDSSRNSETGGSGIGLSLAKSIVESHKGKITAKCGTDGFITFTVVL